MNILYKNNGMSLLELIGILAVIFIILAVLISILTAHMTKNPQYEKATPEEKLEFELSKANFEKHKQEYEDLKDCFLENKKEDFTICKGIKTEDYLNKLKLRYIRDGGTIYGDDFPIDIFFGKIDKIKRRGIDGYVYINNGLDLTKYKIEIDKYGNKYIQRNYYKYIIINKNWLIAKQIKGYS